MSERTNPFDQLERLFRRMGERYDETAEAWTFEDPFGDLAEGAEVAAMDLVERDVAYVVTVDLPGFDREDVDVSVTDHTLRIAAERETGLDEEDDRYVHRERHHESVQRSIRLPEPVRTDDVTATMENGLLTVRLPREQVEEAHRIEIE